MLSRTVDATELPSIDESKATPPPARRVPTRWLAFGAMLLTCCLIGAAAASDVVANFGDLGKIIAVFAFIIAMLALALGMVGDAYRS